MCLRLFLCAFLLLMLVSAGLNSVIERTLLAWWQLRQAPTFSPVFGLSTFLMDGAKLFAKASCMLEFRLGMASFSVLHSFLLVSLMLVCSFVCPIHSALSFHTLVPCCSAAESFALDLRHIRIRIIFCWTCCSASNLNLRRTHLFSTIVVIKVGVRIFCLFGLLRVLFTRVLENFGCGFCILRSGIQRHAHLVALAFVLLMLPNRLLLILAPILCAFSFGVS